jgi:archaellum biogenesis protein FlaJ (TadC family)
MEMEQFTFEWSADNQKRKLKGRNKKIPRIKQKWKYNLPEALGKIEDSVRGKFIAMCSFI